MAVDAFINISHKLLKVMNMLRNVASFNEESTEVKNILDIMGGGINQPSYLSSSNNDSFSESESDLYNTENIQQETLKITDDLEGVCDYFHKNYLKIQK